MADSWKVDEKLIKNEEIGGFLSPPIFLIFDGRISSYFCKNIDIFLEKCYNVIEMKQFRFTRFKKIL